MRAAASSRGAVSRCLLRFRGRAEFRGRAKVVETPAVVAPHNSADSPVMRQFLDIKGRYPDAIVMFRMGDFYEMFFEDAVTVGPVLDIAVTSRDKQAEDPVPMAGVPWHAVGGYLRTLVERGFKVAIVEQMESPEEARKRKGPNIVHREVVRVVTAGRAGRRRAPARRRAQLLGRGRSVARRGAMIDATLAPPAARAASRARRAR